MAALLLDLGTFLNTKENTLVLGSNMFADFTPDDPDKIVVLQEYGGSGPSQVDPILNRSVQISSRDITADGAKEVIDNIYTILATYKANNGFLRLTENRWTQIYLRQAPFKLREDAKNRIVYGFNLGITTNSD